MGWQESYHIMLEKRDFQWVCLFTQPRNENLAKTSLNDAGLETYLPLYRTLVSHARRRRAELRPLFTRYIFARAKDDSEIIKTAYRLRGVSGYAGKTFANSLVRNEIVKLIRSRETDEGLVAMNFSSLNVGQKVKLIDGPLAGFEAVFQEIDDRRRSWIFIELLGKLHRMRVENRALEVMC